MKNQSTDFITSLYGENQKIYNEEFILSVENHYIQKRPEKVNPLFGLNKQIQICSNICTSFSKYQSGSVVLVAGIPGCGKTRMLKNVSQKHPQIKFIHIPVCDIIIADKYNQSVSTLFKMAKFYQPCVLVLDEFQVLYQYSKQILYKVLQEIEAFGIQDVKVPIFIIENDLKKMNDKIPKISQSLYINIQNIKDRVEMLKYQCSQVKFKGTIDYEKVAERTEGFTGSDICALVRDASYNQIRKYMKDNEGREDILTELQEEDFYPTNSDLLESLERTKGSILEEDRIKLFQDYLKLIK